MQTEITGYLTELDRQYQTGTATEHTYRPALQRLLSAMMPQHLVSNEPVRQVCGAPDLILLRKKDNIPSAYAETKDIGDLDLAGCRKNKTQFNKYKNALDNILFTDYLDFHLYEKKEFIDSVRLAKLKEGKIQILKENVEKICSVDQPFRQSGTANYRFRCKTCRNYSK